MPEKSSVEVVYGLTTLSRRQCPVKQLFRLNGENWAVENRLNFRRDVTLKEDRCGVRVLSVSQMRSTCSLP